MLDSDWLLAAQHPEYCALPPLSEGAADFPLLGQICAPAQRLVLGELDQKKRFCSAMAEFTSQLTTSTPAL